MIGARARLSAFLLVAGGVQPAAAQFQGEAPAVAAAEKLLTAVGGREAWAGPRTFYVEEQVFLRSGEVADLKIWRDTVSGARRLERRTSSGRFVEWLAVEGGFDARNGLVRRLPPEELAVEMRGLKQEPYAIYRQIAARDPELRVELRDNSTLYFFDGDGQPLCWFLLNDVGAPISWANFYNGSINQHYYGPLVDVGDANLPKWGASAAGLRFEYKAAKFLTAAVSQPTP